jgi:hypothetical protein
MKAFKKTPITFENNFQKITIEVTGYANRAFAAYGGQKH